MSDLHNSQQISVGFIHGMSEISSELIDRAVPMTVLEVSPENIPDGSLQVTVVPAQYRVEDGQVRQRTEFL